MPSRKKKTSDEWSVKNAWTWLTTTGHSHTANGSRKSKGAKGSRTKRSQAYCSDGRRMKAVEYGSKKTKAEKKKKKTKLGAVCVCALGCQKEHQHGKGCRAEVICVCAHGKAKGKRHGSRKMSVAYRQVVREGYTRKDGVHVAPTLIEDRGLPGKGPKLIPKLRQGTLRRHGYDSKASKAERHAALRRAAEAEGPTVVIRKLNVVATLNKNTNPKLSAHFKADSAWVKSTFGTTAHPKIGG